MNDSSSRKKAKQSMDEVEELLRAAQDDMLLKLSLNSHIARSSPSSQSLNTIDPDLDRRFEALKTKPKLSTTSRIESDKNPEKVVNNIDESDDLFARFTALKSSLPSYSSSSVTAVSVDQQIKSGEEGNDSADEEDEVEKVINWAKDAARLDPSPPSDSDDDEDEDKDDSDSEKDSDDENCHKVDARKKSKRK